MSSNFGLRALVFATLVICESPLASPAVKVWQTERGARVLFIAAPEIPMVDVRLVFAAGSVRDKNKGGIAKIVNRLLVEGAGNLRAIKFKDRLAATGARLYVDSVREMAFISLRTLSDQIYFEEAVRLLAMAAAEPRFDSQEIKRAIEESRLQLKLKEQSLSSLADESFWQTIYSDHPYGQPPLGTRKSLSTIRKKDLSEFHQTYYVNRNMVIAIVGALGESDARTLSESISKRFPVGVAPSAIPEVALMDATEVIIQKDSKQSHIRLGQVGMKRGDPDYFPLLVGNHVLGGNSLVSVIFKEIRSKRGLSYSCYSYFVPMERAGPFIVGMQTDHSKKDAALNILRKTLKNFLQVGPSSGDVRLAKDNLIKGFPNRIDSNQKMLDYIGMIGFYGLPLDYLTTFPKRVAEVTMEDIRSAFRRRLDKQFTTVIVGKN